MIRMKYLFSLLLLLFAFSFQTEAQEIKIKKKVVYVDGVACMKTTGDMAGFSLYDMEDNELVYVSYMHPTDDIKDAYVKVNFLEQGLTLTNGDYMFRKKGLVKKLIQSKALVDCKLVDEKVERFVSKYDQDMERNKNINIEIKVTD